MRLHRRPLQQALLAAGLAAGVAAAGVPTERFERLRDLQPPAAPHSEIAAVVLDADLFDAVDARFGNLRLADEAGTETPFLVRPRAVRRTVAELVPSGAPAVVESLRVLADNSVEMTVTRAAGEPVPAALRFDTSLRDFEKLVTVEGTGDNGATWTTLAAAAPIFDYARFVDVRRTTVDLAPAPCTRYRIVVGNITERKDSPLVELVRQTRGGAEFGEAEATAFRREAFRMDRLVFFERREVVTEAEADTADVGLGAWQVSEQPKEKTTTITVRTHRQPLVALTLLTPDANFSRTVRVEGSEKESGDDWRYVAEGRVSVVRVGRASQDSLTVAFPEERRMRRYRFVIRNQDNPPLTVASLTGRERRYELLFFPKAGSAYRLYYGGAAVEPPRYDVGAVLAGAGIGVAEAWTLAAPAANAAYHAAPAWQSGGGALLGAAIGAMVIVLAVVIARLARKVDTAG